MKVLIVAKTRRGAGACIGGISFDGQSVRLVAAHAAQDETAGMDYAIGEVWEVEGKTAAQLTPPHVENFVVHHKERLPLVIDLLSFITHYMPPVYGPIGQLYQGFTQSFGTGVVTITRAAIPNYSTIFWRPDQPLTIDHIGKKIRYRYPTADGGRTITFVGFQEPLETIPAGTLLRISLSHWWRPDDKPAWDERCYVQLSGWFLEAHAAQPADGKEDRQDNLATAPTPATAIVSPDRVRQLLKRIFGYETFRAWQEEIITNVLARRDTLVVMATGSGKSLCYQLPALCFHRLTVVVSPLIALMEDQVAQLRSAGVAAIYLNCTVNYEDYLRGMEQVRNGLVKLLYMAPETLRRPETLRLLTARGVDCLVVDEAHCISAWGHDFRKEYRDLMTVRQRLPEAVCIALTATATLAVQTDIKQSLGFRGENTFVGAFDRPNLLIEVKPKQHTLSQVLNFLKGHPDESGILYCTTRAHVEQMQRALVAAGIAALPYHGGMSGEERRRHQEAFMRDDVRVIVATVAFGMGVNKPDVRFVMHIDLPQDWRATISRSGAPGAMACVPTACCYSATVTYRPFITLSLKVPWKRRLAVANGYRSCLPGSNPMAAAGTGSYTILAKHPPATTAACATTVYSMKSERSTSPLPHKNFFPVSCASMNFLGLIILQKCCAARGRRRYWHGTMTNSPPMALVKNTTKPRGSSSPTNLFGKVYCVRLPVLAASR